MGQNYPNWASDFVPGNGRSGVLPASGSDQGTWADWFESKVDDAGSGADLSNHLITIDETLPPRSLAKKATDHPSVFDFVLPGDSAEDFGPAIQRCLNRGYSCFLPTIVPMETPVAFTTPAQMVFGRDRMLSGVDIPASSYAAGITANGYFVASGLAVGPRIRDLGIFFEQPASDTTWVEYAPAINTQGSPRTHLSGVRIELGWVGVYGINTQQGGGPGGLICEDHEFSCIGTNISADGFYDTVRFDNGQIWPFGILFDNGAPKHANATNLLAQFVANAIGYDLKRVDDAIIDGGLTFMRNAMNLKATMSTGAGAGEPLILISNHDFDTYGGLTVSACKARVVNSFFTIGDALSYCVSAQNSLANIDLIDNLFAFAVLRGSPDVNALLTFSQGAIANLTGNTFEFLADTNNNPADVIAVGIDNVGTEVSMTGNRFFRPASLTWTRPAVIYTAGTVPHFVGNRHTTQTASGVPFIQVISDGPGTVAANTCGGTTMHVDPSFTQLQYGLNAGATRAV